MANEKTEKELAAEKLGAEQKLAADQALADKKLAAQKPQEPAKSTPTPFYEWVTDKITGEDKIVTGHITRDSIVQFQRAKFMEAGKSPEEATELAVKRGYEMVKDPPKKD